MTERKRMQRTELARIRLHHDHVRKLKRQSGCHNCGITAPDLLDYHHLPGMHKRFAISRGYGREWDDILEEISRCNLLCANCHRQEHRILREQQLRFRQTGISETPQRIIRRRRVSSQNAIKETL